NAPPSDQWVPRAEFDKMAQRVTQLEAQVAGQKTDAETRAADNEQNLADLEKMIKQDEDKFNNQLLGFHNLVIVGDASVGFFAQKGSNSSFNAAASPLFL